MNKIILAIGLVLIFSAVNAQQKISWSYSAKKLGHNKYEIHLIATPPRRLAYLLPAYTEGGPVPTTFRFNNNALLTLNGKVGEKGKVITYFDENFKVYVKYFEGRADFVQMVTLKGNVKTNISGEVESMICNDKVCMPPTTEKFNVALN
jgi:thiol:disulfide interchange protein DsbD